MHRTVISKLRGFIRNSSKIKGFTLAEALMLLLISSLIIVATMPVITKKTKKRVVYRPGPKDGWVCTRASMPCTFNPPATARAFLFFYNDAEVANFGATKLGRITIKSSCGAGDTTLYTTMDEYKKGTLKLSGSFCTSANKVRITY